MVKLAPKETPMTVRLRISLTVMEITMDGVVVSVVRRATHFV